LRGLPKPDAVIFNSHGLRKTSEADLMRAWPRSPQHVVYNGVNLERFSIANRQLHRPPRVGIIGNLTPIKAHDIFIEMAAQLTRRGPDAEYWIVGRDKGCEAGLRALVENRGLQQRVKFLGYQEDIPSILAHIDLLVCCSHQETFGRCVVEAMAAALPVVGTHVGGLPEVIDDGVTGVLVPPGDPLALADAVARILGDEPLRRSMGMAGQQRAAMFSSPAHAQKILEVYSSVKAGGAHFSRVPNAPTVDRKVDPAVHSLAP
jgi:glycosyltransferase involved in cell wall biosynthesis